MDVLGQIIRVHVDVTNGNRQTQDLLHLELNGSLDFLNLGGHRLAVSQGGREFTSLVQTRAQQTRDLLDESFTREESIEFLGCKEIELYTVMTSGHDIRHNRKNKLTEILDQFLVLVQFLQSISIHAWDTSSSSFITMLLISKNADGHFWSGNMLELDGARETLVLLGIVILKTNLEFNGFQEIPLLIDRLGQKCVHSLIKEYHAILWTTSLRWKAGT